MADDALFDTWVTQALDDLPAWVQEHLENLSVVVAPWPTAEQLRSVGVRRPIELLGLYEGVPLPRRGHGYHLAAPDRITLFQRPLEARARGAALVRLIRRTVVHEVGHHIGFSDADLDELGI
jgi:predicted Zn-dependent protease with MMP-like domain